VWLLTIAGIAGGTYGAVLWFSRGSLLAATVANGARAAATAALLAALAKAFSDHDKLANALARANALLADCMSKPCDPCK
jgi:hypothetical protein